MGLIKAAMGAAGGVLADQWKEFFYCDSMPANILMMKGRSGPVPIIAVPIPAEKTILFPTVPKSPSTAASA